MLINYERSRQFVIVIIFVLLVITPSDSISGRKPVIKESTLSLIKRNSSIINQIASVYNISAVAIAGVVVAEQNLNMNYIDSAQNVLLRSWLDWHDEQWWLKWAATNEQLVKKSENIRANYNKWPIELILSGYVISYGQAQITPRTLLKSCNGQNVRSSVCKGSTKQIVALLLSEEPSTLFEIVAIVLDYEATCWEQANKGNKDIRHNVGLLGTLYSMGGDYYMAKNKNNNKIFINNFGRWVEANKILLQQMLGLRAS